MISSVSVKESRSIPFSILALSLPLNSLRQVLRNFSYRYTETKMPQHSPLRCLVSQTGRRPLRELRDFCSNFFSSCQRESVKISGEVFLFCFLLSSAAFAQTDVAAGKIDSETYQRVVEENLDLRKEQARLGVEAGTLRRKNAALLLDIQDLERKRDQLTLMVSQLKTPDETRVEMTRLQSEKLVLVREIERLRQALSVVDAPHSQNLPAPVIAPAAGSDLFRKIEKENADLRLEVARVRESALNESVGRAVVSKSETSLKEQVVELSARVKQAQGDLEILQKREAAYKKAVEDQAKRAFEAEKKAEDVKRETLSVKSEASEVKREALSVKRELAEVKRELAEMKRKTEVPTGGRGPQVGNAGPSVGVLMTAAGRLLAANRIGDAEKIYLKALKQEPDNPLVCYNMGVLYGDYLKNSGKAIKYYRRYLDLSPLAPDAAIVRGWIVDLEARLRW
jgi:tetratricopeptide (TPR) repeat protein